jgi:hypothetical protein
MERMIMNSSPSTQFLSVSPREPVRPVNLATREESDNLSHGLFAVTDEDDDRRV